MPPGHPPVLLAEPDRSDARLVRRSLEAGGLVNPVVDCADAATARRLLADDAARPPAVLVTALLLPAQAGGSPRAEECLGLVRHLRADPRLAHLPVLVLGGAHVPDGAAVERVHALGATYLAKPVAFGGLVQVIRGLSLPWALTAATQPAPAEPRATGAAAVGTLAATAPTTPTTPTTPTPTPADGHAPAVPTQPRARRSPALTA